jgi:oligoribonuclease
MNDSNTNLIWVDLEMTGLDIDKCHILQFAVLVTDKDLNILDPGLDIVIHQDETVLKNMDEWNLNHHTSSGLLDQVKNSSISVAQAEAQVLKYAGKFVSDHTSPLCGNSIYNDRRFIIKYMKNLDNFLHYRLIDVSTIKELYKLWHPELPEFPKKKTHQALDDIKESIAELKYYREVFFK